MLLKRSIVLAGGVLLFIAAFIIYFYVSNMQMEARFRAEREKFHVEGAILTPSGPATTTAAPSAAPDAGPAPAAPATNSAPATPAPSTMNEPRANGSPFVLLASYRPSDGAEIQMAGALTGDTASPSAPPAASPATNVSPANISTNAAPAATIPSPATNTVPAAPAAPSVNNSGVIQPATGEASVIILLYHQFRAAGASSNNPWNMPVDVFESEMKYIHDNGYHVVPLSDVQRFIKHKISLPPGSVAITIDDGYKSAIVYAAPILKKYGYPWTFFIYPDFITVGEGPGAASWNDLLALQAEGVDIESHSMTHPQLTRHKQKIKGVWHNLTPEEYDAWLTNETAGAKALLEKKMGKAITCFAYPYGDYNKEVEAKAIAAGYEAIFTVADNPVHSTTSLHSIGRYTITQEVEKNFAAYLRQSALGLTKADPEPGATVSNPRPVITAVLAPIGADKIDSTSIETSVRDFGEVRHDFDPGTNTVRLYLPRDLIAPVVLVNIRVKNAETGQIMVANWHFNYEPGGVIPTHPPIAPATNPPSASTKAPAPAPPPAPRTTVSAPTNAPEATQSEPLEKNAAGTPLDTHRLPPASPD
ncbi:MAG TPA: polysaccharide deacetylase family protein [Candidatus Methylacidiphilales bacterium]|jgi:peptidoglycan/xylan/chitin deacetylase (PgdA/CDA1 family)|nr:polysaccharide deacetylase family protein [Candidatus Methylacidiphilales bacterium]